MTKESGLCGGTRLGGATQGRRLRMARTEVSHLKVTVCEVPLRLRNAAAREELTGCGEALRSVVARPPALLPVRNAGYFLLCRAVGEGNLCPGLK